MYNDPQQTAIAPGTQVYDVNGEKVGTVQQHSPEAGYLLVEKGLIFPEDLYIPTSAIERVMTDGIGLNLPKSDLKGDQYTAPPATNTPSSAMGTEVSDQGDRVRGTRGRMSREQNVDVPVREEELMVDKRRKEVGRAAIHKETVAEQQSVNVPVSHEEVHIERVPVDKDLPADQATSEPWQGQDNDIVVPLMGEEVVAEKRPRIKEEIRLHKEPVTETEQVSETVRKERINVEGVDAEGEPVDRWAARDQDRGRDTNP